MVGRLSSSFAEVVPHLVACLKCSMILGNNLAAMVIAQTCLCSLLAVLSSVDLAGSLRGCPVYSKVISK